MNHTMTDSATITDRRREEFPTLDDGIYLLSHSLGPVPRAARRSMRTYLDRWRSHTTENAWDSEWWTLQQTLGDEIGRTLGADAGCVSVQPNATIALYVAASCFDFSGGERSKVVTTALDFPSMGYIWDVQRRRGADVVVVPSDGDITIPTERILDAIDERTALVALAYVSYRSSNRLDAPAIIERAHAVGAKVLLDVYQAAGVCDIDAAEWNVDLMVGGSIKWLCGGPACGYLYVRRDLIATLEPSLTGWFAHARPFDFSFGPMSYDATIRRFSNGTTSIPALYSALPGVRLINEVGVAGIAAESCRRTQRIVEHALERGWKLHSPHDVASRGGTVMIESADAPALAARLAERKVFVDFRPSVGIRLSPHFYNTDDEIDEALLTVGELIDD